MEAYNGGQATQVPRSTKSRRRPDTTVQTVLRIFGGKDGADLRRPRGHGGGRRVSFQAPTDDIKAAVAAFFDIYENVGDLVMARLDEERRRPALKATLDQGRDDHRDGVRN